MAKSKRNRRATHKVESPEQRDLIRVPDDPFPESSAHVEGTHTLRVTRPTIFTAEFEALIELIAIDRVYRAMMERRSRYLPPPEELPLLPPTPEA
ncbi:MAG: hypothetical protein DWQ37_07830 [Planctomycetota bacterium]|nr:MAG: hypothetical protein DWQ37_07830 [Planctomycetota bacterium]